MTLAPPKLLPPSPAPGGRVLLSGISWTLYQDMLAEIRNGGVRLTYEDGWLEIMTLSPLHERVKTIVARVIESYADALGLNVEGFGSTTFGREDLRRGLEPDECYYIAHLAHVLGKDKLDLATDPPPDLAVEVDISPADIAKQPIYAALGVPEVWRYDGRRLTPLHLKSGAYVEADRSLSFPDLPMDRFNQFLAVGLSSGQSAAVRAMREWLGRGRP